MGWLSRLLGRAEPSLVESEPPVAPDYCDLRGLPSIRTRVKGSANYVTDAQRIAASGTEYVLVREPTNEHDSSAIVVYGRGVKLGYVSRAKAASMAPSLDLIGAAGYLVSGAAAAEGNIRLWVDLPRVPDLREFARG
ncbi:hypothetical protein HL652_12420 [Herbiconiux sp. SALV-R1]|uniref:HIRAN domain-containing protein n=1 Tax=unclassified Herbiconiux TaxID=2618217 RepID=UPI0014930FBC|nr:hypothetical protein HL652_12420 [Herbiconiux sp. SALV-R1]